MKNIIWIKPDSTTAVTWIADDYEGSSEDYAVHLQTAQPNGSTIISTDWVASQFNQENQ